MLVNKGGIESSRLVARARATCRKIYDDRRVKSAHEYLIKLFDEHVSNTL